MIKRIVLDSDGVITDFHNTLLAIHNKMHKTNYNMSDLTAWKLPGGMDKTFKEVPEFFVDLPLLEGAKAGIDWIASRYDLVIATSPAGDANIARDKLLFFEKHLPAYRHSVTITDRKDIFYADLIIDDAPHHIKRFPGHRIVMSYPFNNPAPITSRYITGEASDWNGIIRCISMIDSILTTAEQEDNYDMFRGLRIASA